MTTPQKLKSGLSHALHSVSGSPGGLSAAIILVVLLIIAVIGPWIWGQQAGEIDLSRARQGASMSHLLGTDALGRDILARTLAATGLSMFLALGATAIGAICGIALGGSVGVIQGRARHLVSRIIDFTIAFPPLLLALLVVSMFGAGIVPAVVAVGVSLIPRIARPAQTLAAGIGSSDYVAAARLTGSTRRKILRRHLLPNMSEALFLIVAAEVGTAIVTVSALSFLGFGVQPPDFDWGRMLGEGLESIYTTPLPALVPGLAIFIVAVASNALGDALARGSNVVSRVPKSMVFRRRSRGNATGPSITASGVPLRGTEGGSVSDASQSLDGSAEIVFEAIDLSVQFPTDGDDFVPVSGVSLSLRKGEIVGLVGESGSGKTMLSLAIAGLVPYPGTVTASHIRFLGVDPRTLRPKEARRLLGTQLAMIFQDPSTSMNPSIKVGRQVAEVLEVNGRASPKAAMAAAIESMRALGLTAPERRAKQFPHELSGGMRQRAMAASGLITKPSLLIADEPTTALDVTVQAQLLDTLKEVTRSHGTATLFVSHDIAVVSQICQRVIVMYRGKIVEVLDADDLVTTARHPYTKSLIAAAVDLTANKGRLTTVSSTRPALDLAGQGCRFLSLCPSAIAQCASREPDLQAVATGHSVACWPAQNEGTS